MFFIRSALFPLMLFNQSVAEILSDEKIFKIHVIPKSAQFKIQTKKKF